MSESRKYIEYGKILYKGFRNGLKEIHVDSETEVIKCHNSQNIITLTEKSKSQNKQSGRGYLAAKNMVDDLNK